MVPVEPRPGRPGPSAGRQWLDGDSSSWVVPPPRYRFVAIGVTDRGPRDHNDDAWLAHDQMLVVADGVGGRPAGKVAADLAARTVRDTVPAGAGAPDLVWAAQRAHEQICDQSRRDPARHEMACTLDAVVVAAGGRILGVHVGDSRVYFCPVDGEVQQVTEDEAVDGALVQSLGGTTIDLRPRMWQREFLPGDRVVLASDGLWSGMGGHVVTALLRSTARFDPPMVARLLIDTALAAGATDNVTLVVADLHATGA